MVDANVKIIEDLHLFLQICCNEPHIKQAFVLAEKAFSRKRKLPMERVAVMVLNYLKRSLTVEINEFFEQLIPGEEPCTKGAFCLQRMRLSPALFFLWNKILAESFYKHYGSKIKRWRGFRLMATDGSTTYLVNKPALKEHFGTSANQHTETAMARIMQVEDVLNNITVFGNIYPINKSEQAIAYELADIQPEDTLMLFDRGFAGYPLMFLLLNQEVPRHFLMRCRTTQNSVVESFIKSRKKSKIVNWYPPIGAIAQLKNYGYIVDHNTAIRVRLVKVKLSTGETEVLLTNLYDELLYSVEDLKELYALRWGIEVRYFTQKNQLQLEQFSGLNATCIEQDYLANVFVSNLQNLIEKQCEPTLQKVNGRRKYNYKINRNVSVAAMKHNIVRLFIQADAVAILLALQKAFEKNLEPHRPGRAFARITKSRRTKGRFQTYTNFKRAI